MPRVARGLRGTRTRPGGRSRCPRQARVNVAAPRSRWTAVQAAVTVVFGGRNSSCTPVTSFRAPMRSSMSPRWRSFWRRPSSVARRQRQQPPPFGGHRQTHPPAPAAATARAADGQGSPTPSKASTGTESATRRVETTENAAALPNGGTDHRAISRSWIPATTLCRSHADRFTSDRAVRRHRGGMLGVCHPETSDYTRG